MKKFLAAALASMMLIGGAALALADGELNICSPNSDGLLSIIPVFEEQTGIKVKVESIGTGDCMKRIGSEIAQEYSTFDLMYGGSLANYVANADLFQDYVSDQDQYLMDAYKNTRSYCTNYTIDGSVLLVNTDMLKEMGIEVNGYADLLQPELVGKIASADPASSSSAFCQLTNMLLAMGGYEDDAAWQYVQDLFVGQQVAITSGSSAVYKGGVISYVNEIKHRLLGVEQEILDVCTAVSRETAHEMARGARERLAADCAVSVTGLAGPDGDGTGRPVGLVYIAVDTAGFSFCKELHLSGDRAKIREQAADAVFQLILDTI